ncbi:MAG: enoyl-CoA hydratase-related protein [Acidimicrobiia bacterium]|nr:enoyl-CoA hydratase-related protein [Acidimicrobiia bacterium]
METLVVERSDGVVTVTLNRPEKKNAISGQMWRELTATLREVSGQRDDRVLVLTGAGDAFCSGQDLTDDDNQGRFSGVGGVLDSMRMVGSVALSLHEMPKPTIAAVNGVAAGAGCNLALGCDLIVASDQARFSQIFVKRGLSVDFGGTWLLPRLVGLHKAKELAFLGDILSADEAAAAGLVNRVVPSERLGAEVGELAARLSRQAPLPLSMMKKALNESFALSFAQAVEQEAVTQASTFTSKDTAEAMAAFLEKREPRFSGQ